jgi:hypothetical protein
MEEEAVIATVERSDRRKIDDSLDVEYVNVKFRVLGKHEDNGQVYKAVIKRPEWLAKLQPSAPLDGYLIERGEFSGSFGKDDRLAAGLKIGIDVITR